jgi:PAS domain S-box-containing protein
LRDNEERYRELADSITDVFFAMDKNLRYTYWNKASEDLTGISAKDAIGKSLYDLFPDVKGTRAEEGYLEVLQTGQPTSFINEYKLHGKRFLFEISAYPTRQGIAVFTKDVTERKRMEEEIRRLGQFRESIIDNANVWLDVLDENANVVVWNKAAEVISGYSREEVVGHGKIWEWLYPDEQYRRQLTDLVADVIQRGRVDEDFETTIRRKDGEIRIISWNERNLLDEHGKPIGSIALGRDVTERKRMQEELERYSRHLEELVAERTEELRESEEKYHSLVENIPGVIWTTDSEGRTVFVSPNVVKVTGRTPEEIYAAGGTLWLERMHPDDKERVREAYEALFARNEPYDVEYRLQRKDGEWIWLHDRSVATYEKDGRRYADGLLSDITERRRMEQQVGEGMLRLRESEAKFRGLYDSVRDGILANDVSGRIYECNRAFENMVGYSLDELRNMKWQDITPKHYLELEEGIVREQMLERGFSAYVEKEYIRKDGSKVPVEVAASIVRGTGGKPDMIWCIIRDITERKQMQEALLRSERFATIGQLAAMVGHDLRNPLTGIAGAAYYLRMKLGSTMEDKGKEMFDLIERDIEHADMIVNDLLEYSKELRLELTETSAKSITKDSLILAKVPNRIRVMDSTEDEPRIMLDAEKMKRVFVNLIRNAVEAMPEGGTLAIMSRESDGKLQTSFTDTGVGMTRETMERLWNPLFTTKARGIGLGLPIAKRIVEAHEGSISLESKVGKGTTFTVTLPITRILEEVRK